jgi:hypothetical protein
MRDRTPKTPSAADEVARLRALADKINALRVELDDYLEDRARILASPGVPVGNIKQMLEGRARGCLCLGATLALSDQIAALELEEKQRGAIPEG